jgi:hypothetical protein
MFDEIGEESVGKYFFPSHNYDMIEKWAECFQDYKLFQLEYSDELYDDEGKNFTIKNWCRENCKGDWNCYNTFYWAFENPNDAMLFKLRWV